MPKKINSNAGTLKLRDAKGKVIFSSGQKYDSLKIANIGLMNKSITKSSPKGLGNLVFEVERLNKGGGPSELKALEQVISIEVDTTTNAITSCSVFDDMGELEGEWVNKKLSTDTHASTCASVGLKPYKSFKLGMCAAGERRPRFGKNAHKIVYSHGSWGGQAVWGGDFESGSYCYNHGSKQDNDSTDRTVAYLCK